MIDLILKDIKDEYVRENFVRIKSFVQDQAILRGEWVFFEIEFSQAQDNFEYPHNLGFQPKDIILLSIRSPDDASVIFHYDDFDRTNFNLTVSAACTIRFLAGTYMET